MSSREPGCHTALRAGARGPALGRVETLGRGRRILATGAVLLVLNRARPVRTHTETPGAWLMLAPDRIGIAAHVRF